MPLWRHSAFPLICIGFCEPCEVTKSFVPFAFKFVVADAQLRRPIQSKAE
jgi:hypothetical protein